MANIFQKRNSLSDDSRGTSTQTIVNHMEGEEERSIVNNEKKETVFTLTGVIWIAVNEEAEYEKVYKYRKGPNALLVLLPHWLLLLPKLPGCLLFLWLKRQLRTLC